MVSRKHGFCASVVRSVRVSFQRERKYVKPDSLFRLQDRRGLQEVSGMFLKHAEEPRAATQNSETTSVTSITSEHAFVAERKSDLLTARG